MTNSNCKLTSVKWGLLIIEVGTLSKNQASLLSKLSSSSYDESKKSLFFWGVGEKFEERLKSVYNTVKSMSISGKLFQIYDKQFGMIQNTWNGTIPEKAKPFTQAVILKDRNQVSVISMSKKQFENALVF